jgi:hypothetical protein
LDLHIGTNFEVMRSEAVEGVLKLRLKSSEITVGITPAARVWAESKLEVKGQQ